MNNIFEYILIGAILLLIIKLLYEGYKMSKSDMSLSKLKKLFRPCRSFLGLNSDTITSNSDDEYSYDNYDGTLDSSEDSRYASADDLNSYYSSEEATRTVVRRTDFPFNEQGNPINLDKTLKAVLDNTDYVNDYNDLLTEDDNADDVENEDRDNYMKSQLNFNDKVNGTSKDAPDMVDKINQYRMLGGVCKPAKIQDVYDHLTASPY